MNKHQSSCGSMKTEEEQDEGVFLLVQHQGHTVWDHQDQSHVLAETHGAFTCKTSRSEESGQKEESN